MSQGTAPDAPAADASNTAPEWVRVAALSSLPPRYDVRIRGRRITVLTLLRPSKSRAEPQYYAIDSVCYHMGGPLGSEGREVRVGNRNCVKCPWHSHLIDLETGEGLYNGERGMQSRGVVQRVHDVETRDDGGIWVRLRTGPDATETVRSDEYAFGPKFSGIRTDYFQLPALDW